MIYREGALYNEIEPYAASWIENLVGAGHLNSGRVERRSIAALTRADVAGAVQFHAFAGIGVWSHALRLAGWPDDRPVWTGSCPCQPFSLSGRRKGFADERHLWPEWFRLIRQCRPPTVFGEQVASPDGRNWLRVVFADLEELGYRTAGADLCAASVGAPHIRQRLYFVAYAPGQRCDGLDAYLRQRQSRQTDFEVARIGEVDELANAGSERRCEVSSISRGGGEGSETPRMEQRFGHSNTRGVLADASSQGRQRQGCSSETEFSTEVTGEPGRQGATGELEYTDGARGGRNHRTISSAQTESSPSGQTFRNISHSVRPSSSIVELGDACSAGLPKRSGAEVGSGPVRDEGPTVTASSITRGFWTGAEWIQCTDGKARPTQSGIQCLANGIPARVGKLRAIGNAIVPQVAATFIKAVMGCN